MKKHKTIIIILAVALVAYLVYAKYKKAKQEKDAKALQEKLALQAKFSKRNTGDLTKGINVTVGNVSEQASQNTKA